MTTQEKKERNIARVCFLLLLVMAILKLMFVSPSIRKSIGDILTFSLFLPRYLQLILALILFKVVLRIVKFIHIAIS